jgi:hypothetical protein
MKITKQHTTGIIVVAILFVAGSFFGGMKYQQSKQPSFGRQFTSGGANGARTGGTTGGNRAGTRPIMGQIISSDTNSITVKMQDGSSKIVIVTTNTAINKSAEGTISDLTAGQTVSAFGTDNTDGSVTAQNIQLNPQARGASGSGMRVNNP